MKPRLCFVLFTTLVSVLRAQDTDFRTAVQIDSATVPVYLRYRVTRVPLLHRPIKQGLRWTTVGAAAGIGAGLLMDSQRDIVFIPYTFIFGVLGSGAGLLAGTTVGLIQGIQLRDLPHSEYPERFTRCRFGYEYLFLSFGLASGEQGEIRFSGPNSFGGMRLLFRPLSQTQKLPDRLSLGFLTERWGKGSDYDVESFGDARLYRIEASARYNFSERNITIPYWGAGVGYAWGYEREILQGRVYNANSRQWEYETIGNNERKIRAPVLRAYLGGEINCFDFFHADLRLGYEPIGPQLFFKNKENFHYLQSIILECSFGTYIF